MPRPKSVPKYSLHKGTGQAVCYVNRREVYLGVFGSKESRQRYAEVLAGIEREDVVERFAKATPNPLSLTVADLCLKFATEVLPKYLDADGKPSAEQDCYRGVIKIVRTLFGETPAADFGPVKLRLCRDAMIAKGWARRHINKQVSRLRAVFKFGISWEIIPATVETALKTLAPLAAGDGGRETKPKTAVPDETLKAVRGKLTTDRHRDLWDLMLLTGSRPGELLGLRMRDLDRSGNPWRAALERHKNARKGKSRTLYFHAKAQSILLKYLKANPDELLFGIQRKTFTDAIVRACGRAGVERFTAHTLRHCVATRITNEIGLEAAQQLLGHSSAAMTAHYSKLAQEKAVAAAAALG